MKSYIIYSTLTTIYSGCYRRSDDCFESYTERELLRKISHFKELWETAVRLCQW